MENDNFNSNNEEELIEILKLLEESYKSNDTNRLIEINVLLEAKFKDLKKSIPLLFHALTLKSIRNKEISLDLHKSVLTNLKNIFLNKEEEFDKNDIFQFLQKFIEMTLNPNINSNLANFQILPIIQNIIHILLSIKIIVEIKDNTFINQFLEIIINSINSAQANLQTHQDIYFNVTKSSIILTTTLLTSKCVTNENYEKLLDKYYISVINNIFKNVPNYIDPKNHKYNYDFFQILKYVYDSFYKVLLKLTEITTEEEKKKEISLKLFDKYGLYSFELIQIIPPFDENTAKEYGKENPIVVFNIDKKKCEEINNMKSKIFQFLSYILQLSTSEEKEYEEDKIYIINNKDLEKITNNLINLIIKSLDNILQNKNKFLLSRKYDNEMNENEDCYNILLYQICIFLSRALIREPIKSEFKTKIKQFLLNILFPIIITVDEEIKYAEDDPEGYHEYLNHITSEFKIKDLRTSACFLIHKICDKYEDIDNFILSFSTEMLNYILNEGKINNELSEYNIYLKYIKNSPINNLNDIIKMDFSLLIILILKENISDITFFTDRLKEILLSNQEKIHLIQNPLIKIKICKLYNYFLQLLFKDNKDIPEEKANKFLENTINYLLNNIVQNKHEKGSKFMEALAQGASESINEIFYLSRVLENKFLMEYLNNNLEKNFPIFIKLIENIDVYSFYLVIQKILSEIKISQRNLIFECLNNLYKKYQKEIETGTGEIENKMFVNQFFIIIRRFLTGKNKLNVSDKQDIVIFNKIFEPIVICISNTKRHEIYDEIIEVTEIYIRELKGINNISALVLKNITNILDLEKVTSSNCFAFVSTFLANIQNKISDMQIDEKDLFNEILNVIGKSFSFKNDMFENSKLYALLLTTQILNLNPNINFETYSALINKSFDCFKSLNTNDDYENDLKNINQLSLANVCLGFIYQPENTLKILNNSYITYQNSEISKFDQFLQYLFYSMQIKYPDYNQILGKCIILGICGLLNDKFCMTFLNNNKNKKLALLRVFIIYVNYHIKEKGLILEKLMKKEINCDFIGEEKEDDEEEEEEDDEDEIDSDFNDKIVYALSGNDNIKNSDEFQYFTNIMKKIKENDAESYNFLINMFRSKSMNFEKIFLIRNIKVKYKGKEINVPRRTVKIVRT